MFGGESEILFLSLSVFLLLPLCLILCLSSTSLDWLPSHDTTHSKCLLCQLFRVHPLKSSASFVCIASSTLYSHRSASASESGLYCQKQNDVIYCGRQLSLFVHTLDLQTCCFCCFRSSLAYLIWCSRRDKPQKWQEIPPNSISLSHSEMSQGKCACAASFSLTHCAGKQYRNTKHNENHLHSRNKAKVLIMLRPEMTWQKPRRRRSSSEVL